MLTVAENARSLPWDTATRSSSTYTSDINTTKKNQLISPPNSSGDNIANGVAKTTDILDIPISEMSKFPIVSSPSPVAFSDIETAAIEFDRVLSRTGISGAKAYSIKCHIAADASTEWSKTDFCVAFDFAADYVDQTVSRRGFATRNAYFSFMSENAADHYAKFSANLYLANQRISALRDTVRIVTLELVSARVARDDARRAVTKEPDIGAAVNSMELSTISP